MSPKTRLVNVCLDVCFPSCHDRNSLRDGILLWPSYRVEMVEIRKSDSDMQGDTHDTHVPIWSQ
jgi:hypothetical protein